VASHQGGKVAEWGNGFWLEREIKRKNCAGLQKRLASRIWKCPGILYNHCKKVVAASGRWVLAESKECGQM
jgi:hypothetical protein